MEIIGWILGTLFGLALLSILGLMGLMLLLKVLNDLGAEIEKATNKKKEKDSNEHA